MSAGARKTAYAATLSYRLLAQRRDDPPPVGQRAGSKDKAAAKLPHYAKLAKRDKLNLDLLRLKDTSATDPDSLPPPDEIAAEIVGSLERALEQFCSVAAKLGVA